MKYYFDFDNTLVRTHHLRPYRVNEEGRDYLAANPHDVQTTIVNSRLVGIIKNLGDNAIILTNSPENYAKSFLNKHGFPKELQVIGNAKKPCGNIILPSDSVYIGDEPKDILFAHQQKIPSIAYIEAAFFHEDNIKRSQPTRVAKNAVDLEKILSEKLVYAERKVEGYNILQEGSIPNIPIASVIDYYPTDHPKFKSTESKYLLTYKTSKDYTSNEINGRSRDDYFYKYAEKNPARGPVFKEILGEFYKRLNAKVVSMNLKGKFNMIGLPNSLPAWCYLSDVNYNMACKFNNPVKGRNIYRINPVPNAHDMGIREADKHIGTLAIPLQTNLDLNVANIILLDDITTTGTQINCAAALLRQVGYKNNIIGIALGKTISN